MKTTGLFLLFAACAPCTFAQTPVVDTTALPQVFAPGLVSTPYDEWATSFRPDGRTVLSSEGGAYWRLCSSVRSGDTWSKARIVPFSGEWNDTDPFITPDG